MKNRKIIETSEFQKVVDEGSSQQYNFYQYDKNLTSLSDKI